jgi:hypothetical protein
MSISQLFPEEGPSLSLNFAGSKILDPRITFTRTSSGTRTNSQGLIEVVPANYPRFDHRYVNGEIESLGLLVEEQRTNLFERSEEFSNSYWTKTRSSVENSSIIAPDGSTNAFLLKEDTSVSETHTLFRVISFESGFKYSYSIFAKAYDSGNRKLFMLFGAGAFPSQQNASFDLVNGIVESVNTNNGSEATIEKYPNGWYRCTLIGNTTTSSTTSTVILYLQSGSTVFYTGDGTSGIYIWGSQLEKGSFPTSYIPTVASTVTRNQDRVLIDGERFLQWYNPVEGTFFCSTNDPRGTVVFGVGNTFDNTIYTTAGGSFSGAMRSGGSGTSFVGTISNSGTSKVAFGVKTDNSALCINGVITGSSLTADMPINPIRLTLGASPWSPTAGDNQVDGTIAQLTYYPTRLPNNILQNLTR